MIELLTIDGADARRFVERGHDALVLKANRGSRRIAPPLTLPSRILRTAYCVLRTDPCLPRALKNRALLHRRQFLVRHVERESNVPRQRFGELCERVFRR